MWTAATFGGGGVRGFNGPGDISAGSMSDMAATGANVARVFVSLNLSADGKSYLINADDLANLNSVVQSGKQLGFKVVLVLAVGSAQSVPEFWSQTGLQASIVANWITIAQQHVGDATIAAYDLLNEPIAPNGQSQWISLASQMITAIRNIDADHVIVFEPSPGGIPESFSTMTEPLPYTNIVYSVHAYEPYPISTQGIGSTVAETYPSPASSSLGLIDKTWLSENLDPVRQFANNFHVSIYVGEFSCVRWAPGTSAYQFVNDSISVFEAAGFSWTYHQWRSYPGWDAELPESYFQSMPYVSAMPQGWTDNNWIPYRSGDTDTMTALKQYFTANIH
jgi:hypothetical protein